MKITLEPAEELEVIIRGDVKSTKVQAILSAIYAAHGVKKLRLYREDRKFLFQANALNKFAALALHMVLCMFIVLATCLLLSCISSPAEFMVHIFPLFLVIYIILAVVFSLHDRMQVRQINQKLRERK
ncbi:MAG: DUF3021 family protein [Butyricicoccaceae bacterium]